MFKRLLGSRTEEEFFDSLSHHGGAELSAGLSTSCLMAPLQYGCAYSAGGMCSARRGLAATLPDWSRSLGAQSKHCIGSCLGWRSWRPRVKRAPALPYTGGPPLSC